LAPQEIFLQVRPNTKIAAWEAIIDVWYRNQLKETLPNLISKWEPRMGVKVKIIRAQKMKSRWGSYTPRDHYIRFSSNLAKKPPPCLEFVLEHELAHLLEPSHNRRFYDLMDQFMPEWKSHRDLLNNFPVKHVDLSQSELITISF